MEHMTVVRQCKNAILAHNLLLDDINSNIAATAVVATVADVDANADALKNKTTTFHRCHTFFNFF